MMKYTLAVCAVALSGDLSLTAQTFVLNPDNGHYYAAVFSRGISWADARTQAGSISFAGSSGYLATVTSEAENSFLAVSFFDVFRNSSSAYSAQALIGGYQNPNNESNPVMGWHWINNEGTFPGINGSSTFDNNYSNWASASDAIGDPFYSSSYQGEPNDSVGGLGSEQVLAMFRFSSNPRAWNDVGGYIGDESVAGYIVEVTPVPEPSFFAAIAGCGLAAFSIYRRTLKK
jgi:hypothetical protein